MTMLLDVKNLRTWLRSGDGVVKAVDDVSFSIAQGETYCLVGESGSGKSVTGLSIIQLLPQDIASHPGGEIWFDYRHDDGRRERIDLLRPGTSVRRIRGGRIGMIFQEPMTSLNPVFTVGEQSRPCACITRASAPPRPGRAPSMPWHRCRSRTPPAASTTTPTSSRAASASA
jgi:peptide/nickel transport system ATP-binding protein